MCSFCLALLVKHSATVFLLYLAYKLIVASTFQNNGGVFQLLSSVHVCRPAVSECDVAEMCDGLSSQVSALVEFPTYTHFSTLCIYQLFGG